MSDDARMAPAIVPGAECRINALPDNMLLLIMSHLFARQVVHTCVLSRRWRNLWRSVPRINVYPDEFYHMADEIEDCEVLFKKFVSCFLMLRNPVALDEFQLWYNMSDYPGESGADSEDANLWIRHALECNAQSVKVTIRYNFLQLVPTVFTSGRFLMRLHLSSVHLLRGFFRQLETSCQALKHLFLDDCCIYDVEITSNTLKVLTMDIECRFIFDEQPSISIPSLVYLTCTFDHEVQIPLLKNMESLETARASLYTNDIQVDDIRQFLKGLSGVTDLNFGYYGNMPKMENNIQWCPKFNNLTTLTLNEWCLHPGFYPLIVFLQNSPNLQDVTLELGGTGDEHQRFHGELEKRSFSCKDLDTVEIVCRGFSEDDPVLNSLVKLLTDNGIDSHIRGGA